jgi:hypothetical protein
VAGHPDAAFSGLELVRHTGIGRGAVHVYANQLVEDGVLEADLSCSVRVYRLTPKGVYYVETYLKDKGSEVASTKQ